MGAAAMSACGTADMAGPWHAQIEGRALKEQVGFWHDQMRGSPASQALFDAALTGDERGAMVSLVKHGDPNSCNKDGLTALMVAAAGGYVEIAKLLVTSGASVNRGPSLHGLTALGLAASRGQAEIVQLLLEWTADLSPGTRQGTAPLMRAANSGHLGICGMLLEAKAQVNAFDRSRVSPLMLAVGRGHAEVAMLLMDRMASVYQVDRYGRSALSRAVDVMLRLKSSASLKLGLQFAPIDYWFEVCRTMIGHGAALDLVDTAGETLLARAVWHCRKDVVDFLLSSKAPIDQEVPCLKGGTALLLAAHRGYRELCELLVRYGADLDHRNIEGETALLSALQRGDQGLAFCLLDSGAGSDPQALRLACESGCSLIYRRLLEKHTVCAVRPGDEDLQSNGLRVPRRRSQTEGESD